MSRRIKLCLEHLGELFEDHLKFDQHPITADSVNRVRNGSLLHQVSHPKPSKQRQSDRLRVGFFLGWSGSLVQTYEGFQPPLNRQLHTTIGINNPNWDLIGMLEPDTWEYGLLESTLRDYEMLDGMIDASSVEELLTLDAIFIGDVFAMLPRVLKAIISAVEQGVGLYNEAWLGVVVPGIHDKRVLKLMLCDEAAVYHTPIRHDAPTDATVHHAHPCIKGIKAGTKLTVGGCGPVCQPSKDTQILIAKDHMVIPTHQAKPDMTPGVRPVLSVGNIGKGRVVNLYLNDPWDIAKHPLLQGDYFSNMIQWITRSNEIKT